MHYWNDDWFSKYGADLYNAQNWILNQMNKEGYRLSSKEKYGTLRYEFVYDKDGSFNPPEGLKYLGTVIEKAIKKWPHLTQELVVDFDYEEYLPKELQMINKKYWGED